MSHDQITSTSLISNIIPLNNVLTDINFIRFTVGLKVCIILIICVKFQINPKSFDMLLRHIKFNDI
jgi:hypothetical protein